MVVIVEWVCIHSMVDTVGYHSEQAVRMLKRLQYCYIVGYAD